MKETPQNIIPIKYGIERYRKDGNIGNSDRWILSSLVSNPYIYTTKIKGRWYIHQDYVDS